MWKRQERKDRSGAFVTADEVAKDSIEAALNGKRAWDLGLLESADQAGLLSSFFSWRSSRPWRFGLPAVGL